MTQTSDPAAHAPISSICQRKLGMTKPCTSDGSLDTRIGAGSEVAANSAT